MIRRLAVAGFLVVTLLPLIGCQRNEESAAEATIRPVLSMVVAPPSELGTRLAGLVASQVQADLGFRLGGRLGSRNVDVGDSVTAGQVVAAIDATSLELVARAAKADLASAEAQLENAQGIEERQRELLAGGTIPETSFELVDLRYRQAQATLTRAQSNLRKAEDQLGYTQLRAEFDGVVTAVFMDPGNDLMPGQKVLTIAKPGLRDAIIDVPDLAASAIAVGNEFTVSLQLDPFITARGVLREVAPEADPATRTRRIKVGLIDPPTSFRIGATVSVAISAGDSSPIAIPLSAVREADHRTFVWVIDTAAGTVSQREITLDHRVGNVALVASGLEQGTHVAVAGVNTLVQGQKVSIAGGSQ